MPPLHHQVVTATVRTGESAAELREARAGARERAPEARRALRSDPERPRRDRRVGIALLHALRSGADGEASSSRRAGDRDAGPPGTGARGCDPLPQRPGHHTTREERPRDRASQRLARAHRGGNQGAVRRARRRVPRDEHPQGLRRRRLGGRPGTSEADGAGRRHQRRRAHPRRRAALPRVHLDPEGGSRSREDRESRDARLRRPRPERLLRARNAPAPLAPVRGRGGLVPDLRLPGTTGHDLPAGPRGPAGRRRRSPRESSDAQSEEHVRRDYERHRRIGHAGSIQTASRLASDVVGPDGTRYPKGTAVPQRADFNTLDNPFFWSADPVRDAFSEEPAAGLHFVVFNPTSDDFRRTRLAMDGVLPGGPRLVFEPGSRGRGFNSILATTHRQNFLVPPRAHRSFPLSELPA